MDNQEEKIGFKSGEPNSIDVTEKKLPGKKLRTPTKIITIFGIILSVITLMYYALPIFSAVIGVFIGFLIICFIIVVTVFTVGIIFTVDWFRDWVTNHGMDVPTFFFNLTENVGKLAPYFYVVSIPALVFTLSGFVLAIIGKSKKYPGFTAYIVLNAIFLTLTIISIFLFINTDYSVNG